MFEELFVRSSSIQRCQTAPLAEDRLRYLRYLEAAGAKQSTLRDMANVQLHLVRSLDLERGDRVNVSRVEAASKEWSRPDQNRYVRRRRVRARPDSTRRFFGRAVQWLRFLGRLEEPARARHPHTAEVAAYEAWMRGERGLSEQTIQGCCAAVDQFFGWLSASEMPLVSIGITDIDTAIAAKHATGRCNRTTINIYARRLRAFFRFAEDQGWCMPGMAAAIIPGQAYPDETVPAGLTRKDILRLLATTEGNRPVDKRDRAILMLLVAYGMRAGEVRALELDDLDWENETFRLRRPKSGTTHFYPLSRSVGQAILRYILDVRPARPERALFFSLTSPIRPIRRSVPGNIVRNRLARLGIVTGRRGPHALRHGAAQHLLDQGMSMKVIGDFLGHRDPSSTAIYAKIDINALRTVADFSLGDLP